MSTSSPPSERRSQRLALLLAEEELVAKLHQVLTQERQALVHVDSPRILQFASQKVALLDQLKAVRDRRGGIQKEDLNDRTFRSKALSLKRALKESRSLLERNMALIVNMERLLKGAVATFNRALSEGNLYNPDGSERYMIVVKTTNSMWG